MFIVEALTFSCLKKQSIFNSRNTLLQETRFWKTLGIFLRATRFPSLGSVTDLDKEGEEEKEIKISQGLRGFNKERVGTVSEVGVIIAYRQEGSEL